METLLLSDRQVRLPRMTQLRFKEMGLEEYLCRRKEEERPWTLGSLSITANEIKIRVKVKMLDVEDLIQINYLAHHHRKVLFSNFHLKDHLLRFHTQTKTSEPIYRNINNNTKV